MSAPTARTPALALALLFTLSVFTGCFGGDDESTPKETDVSHPSIWERHTLEWNTSHTHSFILERGPYQALDVQEATFGVDTSSVWETGPPNAEVHLSYWLPSNTLDGEQVPVIAVVSPYFSFGQPSSESTPTNVVGAGRGEFIFQNFVPHGYAFAQVAVFGTEESSGCFDYRGAGEQLGIDAAVTWLGTQEWSNGNVGLYGKSYEGATQWEAAVFSNPYLKTIVPISGTSGLKELLYKNGSAEARSQVMHMNYFSSTVDYDEDDMDNVCPDIVEGLFAGPGTYILGEFDPYMDNYYAERSYIERAHANYNGSIYWVQGLQDWNVDSHMVFPHYDRFLESGFDVRGMVGQWGHHYPDQWTSQDDIDDDNGGTAFHNMTRWDWGQDLFEWFEYYLKGRGPKPESFVQIQRNDGEWRIEPTWPPEDSVWTEFDFSMCTNTNGNEFVGGAPLIGGPVEVIVECPGFAEDVHISGLPTLHMTVHATGDGGQIFVELQDADTGLRLGHATMDVRYHDGGQEPQTVYPGQSLVMNMEFFGIDAFLPAGHGLRLVMTSTGKDYLAPACSCPVHIMMDDTSVLTIPTIERDGSSVLIVPQPTEE